MSRARLAEVLSPWIARVPKRSFGGLCRRRRGGILVHELLGERGQARDGLHQARLPPHDLGLAHRTHAPPQRRDGASRSVLLYNGDEKDESFLRPPLSALASRRLLLRERSPLSPKRVPLSWRRQGVRSGRVQRVVLSERRGPPHDLRDGAHPLLEDGLNLHRTQATARVFFLSQISRLKRWKKGHFKKKNHE